MTVVEIKFESWQLSDEQFFQLCQDNRDLRLERNPKGDLIIMPPTGGKTGNSNGRITMASFNPTTKGKIFTSISRFCH